MAGNELSLEILRWLWDRYRTDSNGVYDIAPLCRKHGSDPVKVSNNLRNEGLIKDEVTIEKEMVCCAISMKGIALVDPQFIEGMIDKVLAAMTGVNSIHNIMVVLKLDQNDFQMAFDLANEMQNRDLVKLLYAFQPGKLVNVEMTLEGVRKKRTTG
jgi:hypothetical protein